MDKVADTEPQWLACDHPLPLLRHIRRSYDGRKLRLYDVACCHRISHLISNPRSQSAVAAAEQFAEGLLSVQQLAEAHDTARTVADSAPAYYRLPPGPECDLLRLTANALRAAANAANPKPESPGTGGTMAVYAVADAKAEWAAQASLLRCIFGNPFRPITLKPS
jgi:hypothetical protein